MPDQWLTSWKEIAAHLGVSVRTAQRWEATEGMPVQRHLHSRLSSVFADRAELNRWWESRPAGGRTHSIAVLPFESLSRDEESEILGDGLTEELITTLSQVRRLRVIARSSSFWFKSRKGEAREIGLRLGVENVLEGSLRLAGRRLRVTAQLVRSADGYCLWARKLDRELGDPLDLQEQLAQAIARSLRVQLLGQDARPRRPRDGEAYNALLRGRFFWNQRTTEGLEKAIGCFEEAIARDPGFAAAHAALADCYVFLWTYGKFRRQDVLPKAEAAASRALELDGALADARTSLGLLRVVSFDLPAAGAAFRRALELNPGDHKARHWNAMVLACLGRLDEAITEIEQALELDPFGITVNQDAGRILYEAGRHDEAVRRLRHTLSLAPGAYWAQVFLVLACAQLGDHEGALAAASVQPELDAWVRARSGDTGEAQRLLGSRTGRMTSCTWRGVLNMAIGRERGAIELFERGVRQRERDTLELYPGLLQLFREVEPPTAVALFGSGDSSASSPLTASTG